METLTVNFNIRHRLTQIIVFVTCVLICMLASQVAEARGPKPPRFDKPKYRVFVCGNSSRVVKILHKKRAESPKASFLAFGRKNRTKQSTAQAETDI